MLAGIVAFARTPLGRNVLAGLAVILLLLSIYGAGQHKGAEHVRKADEKALVKAKADVSAHEATAAGISSRASTELAGERVRIETRTKTLIQKVPVYVDAKADAACTVGTGFVSMFNAAASGEAALPRPPGGSGGPPSGVPLSAILSTTVEDFGVAYDWRAEALKWRAWYRAQSEAWSKP